MLHLAHGTNIAVNEQDLQFGALCDSETMTQPEDPFHTPFQNTDCGAIEIANPPTSPPRDTQLE